jgi:CheY-like chemotaxis protein
MLQQMLTFAGYHADVASGADEALKVYKPGAFDLVLTDYSMPGLKGDALAAAIRKQAPGQRIVMLTGFDEGVASCNPAGVDLVVSKPLNLNEFLPAIARLFETPRPAAVA